MPGRRREGIGRRGWMRRPGWLGGRQAGQCGGAHPQGVCAGWNDLAYFVLIARLALDGKATESVRIACEDRILRDARRLAAMGFFELFAVRPAPLRAMLEGEGVVERR